MRELENAQTEAGALIGGLRVSTMSERLQNEREQILLRLKQLDKILDLMEKQPNIKEILDSLSELGHFRY